MKLRTKLLLVLVPLTAIPIGVFGWLAYAQQRDIIDREASIENHSAIDSVREVADREIESIKANVDVFSVTPALRQYVLVKQEHMRAKFYKPHILKAFKRHQRRYPSYYEMRVLLDDGQEDVRSTLSELPNTKTDESGTSYFSELLNSGGSVFSKLITNPDNGEPALLVSQKIQVRDLHENKLERKHHYSGMLVITAELAKLQSKIDGTSLAHNGYILVADGEGRILMSPTGNSYFSEFSISEADMQLIVDESSKIRLVHSGVPYFIRGTRVKDDLFILSVSEERQLYESIQYLAILALTVVCAAVIVIAVLLTVILEALVIKPLGQLRSAALAIGDGKKVEWGAGTSDEIGLLAESFQQMDKKLRESLSRNEHIAHHDALTDLPNRRMFMDMLRVSIAQAERQKKSIGILFLDLDDFKRVNDSLGHAVGDALLREVGDRLKSVVRTSELMANVVARLGGDEFIVLLGGLDGAMPPALVASRILEALRSPVSIEDNTLHIKTSIGISIYPTDGTTPSQLMKNADAAMYHAKDKGKNCYQFYTDDLNTKLLQRIKLEQMLHQAIENQEFILHYQPQVDTYTGEIVGVESLVRWNIPDRGLVSPGEFIPVAEESGLIVPMGDWVLQEACKQAKTWQLMGLPALTISVNVSARQFREGDINETVQNALTVSGLESHFLDIELTETAIMENPEKSKETLCSLKRLGVSVSMDDFGTGYSSLSMLQRLPIDCLKVDQSFVADIATSENDAAITTAIIAMGKRLNLKVVAEGVEDAQQLAFLRRHGCEKLQGYLASRPLAAHDFSKLLRRGLPLIDPESSWISEEPKKAG